MKKGRQGRIAEALTNECNGEDAPFTRKHSIYRVFGRKVKGDGQNDISVERTNAPLVNSQKA